MIFSVISDILGIVVFKGGKKMSFIENIKQRAKQDIKTIILPEAEDKRVLEAASKVIAQEFAKVILIGDKKQVEKDSNENNKAI